MIIGNQKLDRAHFLNFLPLGFMPFPTPRAGYYLINQIHSLYSFRCIYLVTPPNLRQPMQIIAAAWLIDFGVIPRRPYHTCGINRCVTRAQYSP